MNRFAIFLMFYLGWFACVAGAARGALWAGPATVAVLLVAHLVLASNRVREGVLVLDVGEKAAFGRRTRSGPARDLPAPCRTLVRGRRERIEEWMT